MNKPQKKSSEQGFYINLATELKYMSCPIETATKDNRWIVEKTKGIVSWS
jgi:hypothetical protein